MEEPRRSSRANKGVHSGRDPLDLYYIEDDHIHKKARTETDQDASDATFEIAEPKEIVRCTPCGTTDENYDEETDNGGLMIECEKCTTWQHAKCMNYPTKLSIPKYYVCDVCLKSMAQLEAPKSSVVGASPKNFYLATTMATTQGRPKVVSAAEAKKSAILAAVKKTRDSVCKALLNVITKTNPTLPDAEALSAKIEIAIFDWAHGTDKKYIDKSRAIMALVKKPVVLERLTTAEISPTDLTTLPVEEIDPELKHYAERVRQELIRRSVLVVEDEQSQRVRRTHKGEEVVESVQDEGAEQNINLVSRGQSRDAKPTDSLLLPPEPSRNSKYSSQRPTNVYQLEDDDDDIAPQNSTNDESKSKQDAHDDINSDDDMDLILERRSKSPEAKLVAVPKPRSKAPLPPMMPSQVWSGDIELPDYASSSVQAEFVSCTKYQTPSDNKTVSFHNRAIRVCKEIVDSARILVQGRLDRKRADPYVEKVSLSRDLFLIKLNHRDENSQYNKLYDYFALKSKVGVISCQATCVKDAYLYAIGKDIPKFLDFAQGIGEGLYMLYIVKKDYIPVGKSILKKALPVRQHATTTTSLDSILSKLGSSTNTGVKQPEPHHRHGHLPPKPTFTQNQVAPAPLGLSLSPSAQSPSSQMQNDQIYQQASSGLTQDQLFFLSEIVNLNGQGANQHSMRNVMQNNMP